MRIDALHPPTPPAPQPPPCRHFVCPTLSLKSRWEGIEGEHAHWCEYSLPTMKWGPRGFGCGFYLGGYFEKFLVGMCRWPLRTPYPIILHSVASYSHHLSQF